MFAVAAHNAQPPIRGAGAGVKPGNNASFIVLPDLISAIDASSPPGVPFGSFNRIVLTKRSEMFTVRGLTDTANLLFKSTDFGDNWTDVTPTLTASSVLFGLDYNPSTHTIIAVGGQSSTPLIVKSSDDGATWMEVLSPSGLGNVSGVHYSRQNNVWIATRSASSATSYYSTDNGVSWTAGAAIAYVLPGIGCFAEAPPNSAWIVGTQTGKVMRSTNNGITWADVTPAGATPTQPVWNAEFVNGVVFVTYGATGAGKILISRDAGVTWTTYNNVFDRALDAIAWNPVTGAWLGYSTNIGSPITDLYIHQTKDAVNWDLIATISTDEWPRCVVVAGGYKGRWI